MAFDPRDKIEHLDTGNFPVAWFVAWFVIVPVLCAVVFWLLVLGGR